MHVARGDAGDLGLREQHEAADLDADGVIGLEQEQALRAPVGQQRVDVLDLEQQRVGSRRAGSRIRRCRPAGACPALGRRHPAAAPARPRRGCRPARARARCRREVSRRAGRSGDVTGSEPNRLVHGRGARRGRPRTVHGRFYRAGGGRHRRPQRRAGGRLLRRGRAEVAGVVEDGGQNVLGVGLAGSATRKKQGSRRRSPRQTPAIAAKASRTRPHETLHHANANRPRCDSRKARLMCT